MKRIEIAIALVLPFLLQGCLAAAAAVAAGGVGYVQYRRNEVQAEYQASLQDTWEATLAALEEEEFGAPAEQSIGGDEAEAKGEGWSLDLKRQPGAVTSVHLRIGTFHTNDHERRAELLFEAIGRRVPRVPSETEGEDASAESPETAATEGGTETAPSAAPAE